jgi:peptidoglycan-N-acetylglucosamine deacetylase
MCDMSSVKPPASVSLDLDNKWSYLKTHGDRGWESFPTYLPLVVPRVLEFLKQRHLTITFFVVGQDAALDVNKDVLRSIAEAGHEVGNHSFKHEPWLHLYSEGQIEEELNQAEESIIAATGVKPIGFRGPGYSLSAGVLRVLVRRGYQYDASTFPTFLGPLARAYYFMTAKLSAAEKKERAKLFGTLAEGFRPLKPYRWHTAVGTILEVPVTTMPVFKLPIHASYLLYLSVFNRAAARLYFRIALLLCRLTRTQPSLLLHPLDFLGCDDCQELAFFPAMNLPSARKIELVGETLDLLGRHYTLLPMREHSAAVRERSLPLRRPRFHT